MTEDEVTRAKRLLYTLERLDQAAQLAIAGVIAPPLIPIVAALPPDTAAALGLLGPTGGASLALLAPRVAPHAVEEVTDIARRVIPGGLF